MKEFLTNREIVTWPRPPADKKLFSLWNVLYILHGVGRKGGGGGERVMVHCPISVIYRDGR